MNLVRWCEKKGTKVLQYCPPDGYWCDVDTVKDWMGETPTPPQPSEREKVVAGLAKAIHHSYSKVSWSDLPNDSIFNYCRSAEAALEYLEKRMPTTPPSNCFVGEFSQSAYSNALAEVRREVFGKP